MRRGFSAKGAAVIVLAIAVFVGCGIYTAANPGEQSVVTKAFGVIITPLQKGFTAAAEKIEDITGYFTQYEALKEENAGLREELGQLRQDLRDAQVALEENSRLRSLLGLQERNRSYTLEAAEITGHSVGNWADKLTIDKGSLAGIEEYDCVISENGMVGYISSVGPTYAEITTVLDVDMQAGVMVTRTRDVYVAEGEYELMQRGLLRLSYIKKDSDIVIGDTIETSGTGGIFPKGVLIGTVEKIYAEENGIANYAEIKPIVALEEVKSVYVIKDFEVTE